MIDLVFYNENRTYILVIFVCVMSFLCLGMGMLSEAGTVNLVTISIGCWTAKRGIQEYGKIQEVKSNVTKPDNKV
jgi:hypothetical protein